MREKGMPLDIGTQEVALIFSGVVCLIGVLGFRSAAKDRQMAELKEVHAQDMATQKWRTEARGLLDRHAESLNTIKSEQRALRDEVRANAKTIDELERRHTADVHQLSGRIDKVDSRVTQMSGSVADLMEVMRGDAEQEAEGKQ